MSDAALASPAATETPTRTWWTDAQVIAGVRLDCERRGVRYYSNFGENVAKVVNHVRKWEAIGGDGTLTTRQLARDLYPDVGNDIAAWRRKRVSVSRWLNCAVRIGALERDDVPERGVKHSGRAYAFRPVPDEVAKLAATCGCSSVGSSVSARRRENAPEKARRTRRWCPRAGRGAAPRLGPLSFSPQRFETPGASGGSGPLRGPLPPEATGETCARARDGSADAPRPATGGPPSGGAATAGAARSGPGALAAPPGAAEGSGIEHQQAESPLAALEAAFVAAFGPPTGGELRHGPTIRRFVWVLARLDRYADMGRGRAGAGQEVAVQRIEALADDLRRGSRPQPPRHLAYLLPELEAEARRWKHTWAPRIKARRRQHRAKPGPASRSRRRPAGGDPRNAA
jgi:hypothetical protein